jgi:hypothetical protein
VSNAFNGTPTTIHLHYDIFQTVAGVGASYVPTYMSLVRSYEELIGQPAEPCGVVSALGESIIDDTDRCFALLGNTQFWRNVDGEGYGGRLRWTYAFTAAQPGAYARWRLDFEAAGRYEVAIYAEPAYSESKETVYRVRAGGAEQELRVDQSAGDGWLPIGEFTFAQGTDQWLQVEDNTGEDSSLQRKISADAIRLVRLDPPAPVPDAGPGGEDVGGGGEIDAGSGGGGGNGGNGGGADAAPRGQGANTTSTSSCVCSSTPRAPTAPPVGLLALACLVGGWRRRR